MKKLLLDLIAPKRCINCNKRGRFVCFGCELFLNETAPVCPMCNRGSFTGETHKECKTRYGMDGLISIWDYDGLIKKAIHFVKYYGKFDIINELVRGVAPRIFKADAGRFTGLRGEIITFVPLYEGREVERGFNQAQVIANSLGSLLSVPVLPLLKRVRDTKTQTKLEKKDRRRNVAGAFEFIHPGGGRMDSPGVGRRVILVDDVWTTGATMRECAKVLKKAGVGEARLDSRKSRQVWGFALARTP